MPRGNVANLQRRVGRVAGVPNKSTRALKEAIVLAAEQSRLRQVSRRQEAGDIRFTPRSSAPASGLSQGGGSSGQPHQHQHGQHFQLRVFFLPVLFVGDLL